MAATSSTNAWAVGGGVILHWNGETWNVQKTPSVTASFAGVGAISASDAWAVGSAAFEPLIEHWNGKAWKVTHSPSPSYAANGFLSGVSATSPTNAWAVGYTQTEGGYCDDSETVAPQALVEHWNGKAWKVSHSPHPCGTELSGVAVISRSDAWAVGCCNSIDDALILRWKGKAWEEHPSPYRPMHTTFTGVAATSSTNAWAVGYSLSNSGYYFHALIEHWNGKAWKVQPSPYRSRSSTLAGVAATSSTAKAVGSYSYDSNSRCCRTLILRWNSKA